MTVSFGALPAAAQRRITSSKETGLWSSPVSPGEEAALRSVGFEPAGIVTASLPSWPFGYQYPAALRSSSARLNSSSGQRGQYGSYYLVDDALTAKRSGGFTRDYVQGTYGGFVPDTGFSWEKVVAETRDRILVTGVLDRLVAEAVPLGAHGIVSIHLAWHRRTDLDFAELEVYDVTATGLAVRVPGIDSDQPPFTAALGGDDVHVLLREGLTPVQLVFGVGVVRADMGNRTRKHMRSLGQVEVPQFSEAVEKSMAIAVADLQRNGASRGEVIVGCAPRIGFERVVGAGLECKVTIVGTAMRRFETPRSDPPLAVLRLSDAPPS